MLCLNFSSINKGVYKSSIEQTAPYDVHVFDPKQPFDDFNKYVAVIDEDYTINKTFEYNVYKDSNHQLQSLYGDEQFYKFDPVMKLSDYNTLLKLRGMDTIELKENEYFLLTDSQSFYIVEDNNDIKNLKISNRDLHLKGIDTKSFWLSMTSRGRFIAVIPDEYVEGLEILEEHLIVDTKEETTAIMASICLYIAFILISAVGTILAIQSLSDSTKYKYRYQTLQRLGVNDKSLLKTIVDIIWCSGCLFDSCKFLYVSFT